MNLKYPWLLLLFLIYIPIILWWIKERKSAYPSLSVSNLKMFEKTSTSGRAFLLPVCRILQLVAIGCLIVAICRPQTYNSMINNRIEGTDIVLALDISESMQAQDLRPNRLEAAKQTAKDFIAKRPQDNIGLVVFSGEALSVMPLTNDGLSLQNTLDNLRIGELMGNTAIGDGLVSAINRVLNGKAVSKSIILLTDGTNNAGDVAPSTATEIAAKMGIKVYTIAVGKDQKMVVTDPYGYSSTTVEAPVDEEALRQIAEQTGGKYFRATDEDMLSQVFEEIDSLEKTEMETESYHRMDEAFFPWILAALCCFGLAFLIRNTLFVPIP